MKLLVVLLAIALGVWLWRRGRRLASHEAPPPRPKLGAPQPMLACAHCGVHVPDDAAVRGRAGVYCCTAHRREAEGD